MRAHLGQLGALSPTSPVSRWSDVFPLSPLQTNVLTDTSLEDTLLNHYKGHNRLELLFIWWLPTKLPAGLPKSKPEGPDCTLIDSQWAAPTDFAVGFTIPCT